MGTAIESSVWNASVSRAGVPKQWAVAQRRAATQPSGLPWAEWGEAGSAPQTVYVGKLMAWRWPLPRAGRAKRPWRPAEGEAELPDRG